MEWDNFSGYANDTGFEITGHLHEITLQTRGYKKEHSCLFCWWRQNFVMCFIFVLPIIIGLLFILLNHWLLFYYRVSGLTFLIVMFGEFLIDVIVGGLWAFVIIKWPTRYKVFGLKIAEKLFPQKSKNSWQYHACEHKLANLLESGEEVNLATLKDALSFHVRCGTGVMQTLTLAEPTLEQYQEILEVAREYFKKLEEKTG